jgi:Spy/CpxP family protein refolding chaperone
VAVVLVCTLVLAGTVTARAPVFAHPAGPGAWEERWRQALGLTEAQVQTLREMRQRQMEAWRQHRAALRQARDELRRLILSEADEAAIQAKRAEVERLLIEGLARRVQALREITPVLTPEQRAKLQELLQRSRRLPQPWRQES